MSKKLIALLSVLILSAMVLGACQPAASEATEEPTEEKKRETQ